MWGGRCATPGRSSNDLQREIAFLEAELSGAVGLGGRDRRTAPDAERARQSVTEAIREAINRPSESDPAFGGQPRRAAFRTGTFSSYSPEWTSRSAFVRGRGRWMS